MISSTDQYLSSCSWSSENMASDTLSVSGTFMRVEPSTRPSSTAPAMVTTLFTDPGSKTLVTAMLSSLGTGGPPGLAGHHVGHGEDLAGAGVHDDDHAALGLGRHDLGGERSLGLVLHGLVDGEHQGGAGRRGLELAHAGGDVAPGRVALHQQLAGTAGEVLLVLHLQAGQALVVEADLADHRRGQRAGRLVALGLLHQEHARQLQGGRRCRPRRPRPCGPGRRRRRRRSACPAGSSRRRPARAPGRGRRRRGRGRSWDRPTPSGGGRRWPAHPRCGRGSIPAGRAARPCGCAGTRRRRRSARRKGPGRRRGARRARRRPPTG